MKINYIIVIEGKGKIAIGGFSKINSVEHGYVYGLERPVPKKVVRKVGKRAFKTFKYNEAEKLSDFLKAVNEAKICLEERFEDTLKEKSKK